MQVLNRFIIYNRKFCSKLEESFPTFFMGKTNSTDDLNNRIAKSLTDLKPRRIIEVGGIDRPLLTKNNDYEYIGIDIEFCENHYSIYDKFIVSSIEEKNDEKAELIISTTLLEHVKDNKKSLNTMYDSLTSGGEMHHYVPSKNHPYSIALRIVGPRMQKILIKHLRPHAADVTGYPAFFNLCGVNEMKREMEKIGFNNINITPYYRATDYFGFFIPLYLIVSLLENIFELLGLSFFAAGMVISAKK